MFTVGETTPEHAPGCSVPENQKNCTKLALQAASEIVTDEGLSSSVCCYVHILGKLCVCICVYCLVYVYLHDNSHVTRDSYPVQNTGRGAAPRTVAGGTQRLEAHTPGSVGL